MSSNNNPITRTLNSTLSAAGQTAGSLVDGLGKTIDQAGRNASTNVAKSTHNWGDTTREFSNEVRDKAGAGGGRSQTANNPLGLSGAKGSVGGRKQTAGNPLGLGKK
ncbi:hypothetical protein MMC16_006769 [Acarospora aff. strigata]|nr:hypothetical protein [Acarospora aff. strigata]